jgi:CRISPR-associated endonuclease/helicase Cas3
MIERAWAKCSDIGILPLADHGTDVAAVMYALLSRGWLTRLAHAAGREITPEERERFLALAFLHDMGKANRGFWLRQFEGSTPVGHTAEVVGLWGIDRLVHLRVLLEVLGHDLLCATLAHHGRPVVPRPKRETDWLWTAGDNYDPAAELADLLDHAQQLFPRAFTDFTEGTPPPRAVSLFAGLLTLADWIGSDSGRFPIDAVTGADRQARSRQAALVAVEELGLGDGSALIPRVTSADFAAAFGVATPREAQARAGDGSLGTLCVLEAETGSGKTEAALWRFLRLFAAGAVDGLYFALPTRTSAVQMHGRVQACLDRTFGIDAVQAVLAVPGYLRAGGEEGERIGRFETLWPDRAADVLEDARWAAETPKRYLSARVAVGTVDQAMLAGLRVRHAHLRAASLARSLLVIDEVHASDTYMTEVVGAIVANHRAAGGHAMLLSATLGAGARTRLLGGGSAVAPPLRKACAVPYPALHGSDAGVIPVATDRRVKAVALTLAGEIGAPQAVARRALEAAKAGARVLVIRNTVRDAVETVQALEALADAAVFQFAVEGVPTLHHGRFAAEDRRLLDGAIEDAFGKRRAVGSGLVAVGTQTLEMSLDLDADLMITDLAPMDVLLQRLGRLHRHQRGRPQGFRTPRAIIAVPAGRDLTPFLGKLPRRHGLGPAGDTGQGIYANLPAIEATWRLLEARERMVVPDDNRELVERATHPEALDAIAVQCGWTDFMSKREGGLAHERQLARAHCLDFAVPFAELEPFPDEEAIRTRLGEDDWRVAFETPVPGPFKQTISAMRIPGWMARGLPLDAPVRVTAEKGGLALAVGERLFRYDRFGLRRDGE